jgi:hypothetical protein
MALSLLVVTVSGRVICEKVNADGLCGAQTSWSASPTGTYLFFYKAEQ